ncbi:hypothetical protein AALO_G00265860 [Alosa alosa]|uniref:Uncharacterized protein n=1 Tax=Alosa alosa TaxID=278164 RepID=A0AAV6FL04_9TELE|nr:hypothetical protein AALO_G00265860 [Alosa alosa]
MFSLCRARGGEALALQMERLNVEWLYCPCVVVDLVYNCCTCSYSGSVTGLYWKLLT